MKNATWSHAFGLLALVALQAAAPALAGHVPLVRDPHAQGIVQFFPCNIALQDVSDPYFRGSTAPSGAA